MPKRASILLLFSKEDNITTSRETMGWIDYFRSFLESTLIQLEGNKPEILLQDDQAPVNIKTHEIDTVLIVISKHLITSKNHLKWLENEDIRKELIKRNTCYIIVKSKIPYTRYPLALREIPRYNMFSAFETDIKQKKSFDYFTPKAEKFYWTKMLELAYRIQKKSTVPQESSIETNLDHKIIFLAETDEELDTERSIIKRNLERRGCEVLPKKTLPIENAKLFEQTVKENLQKSDLSIHLISGDPTYKISDTNESVVAAQNQLAVMHNGKTDKTLSRLVWISPNAKNVAIDNEKQLSFIESIKRGINIHDKLELSEGPFEEFKYMIWEEIDKPREKHIETSSAQRKIYLAYDSIDKNEVKPYIDLIKENHFQLLEDLFEGDFMKVRKHHINNMQTFDVVIIFRHRSSKVWTQMKVLDILKSPGVGRKKPILSKAILGLNCDIADLDLPEDQNMILFCGDENKLIELTKDFLQKINPQVRHE